MILNGIVFSYLPFSMFYLCECCLSISLLRFNVAINTKRLNKRPCQGCVQTVLSGNHKTKSAFLFRLLTETKEAHKKRNRYCQSDLPLFMIFLVIIGRPKMLLKITIFNLICLIKIRKPH